ncbi:MAG: hypothetical protein AAF479_03495 [Pseudomonadota bacterium]
MFSFEAFNQRESLVLDPVVSDFDIDLDVDVDLDLDFDTSTFNDIEPIDLSSLETNFLSGSASASGFGSASASFSGSVSGSGHSSISASAYAYVAPDGSSFSSVSASATGDTISGFGSATAGGNSDSFVFGSTPVTLEPIEFDPIEFEPILLDLPDHDAFSFDFGTYDPGERKLPDFDFSAFLI